MSLLLDALKQAEKQKNAENANDEDLPESKSDEIELIKDEPAEQEFAYVSVNEDEIKTFEPKEAPSLVEKKIDVSIEAASNENKKWFTTGFKFKCFCGWKCVSEQGAE